MKKLREELAAILQKIQEKVEERETVFEDRTERWQESEKGEHFQSKTEELEAAASTLESAIDDLDEFLN